MGRFISFEIYLILWNGRNQEHDSLFSVSDVHLMVHVESLVRLDSHCSKSSVAKVVSVFAVRCWHRGMAKGEH